MGELFVKYNPISAESVEPLAKKVSEEFLGKPVIELVKYMANPAADELNPGYNAEDARRAQLITDGLNDAENNPSQYRYQVKAKTDGETPFETMDLEATLSTYTDSVLRKDSIEEGGEKVNYRVIEMIGEVIDVGGNY